MKTIPIQITETGCGDCPCYDFDGKHCEAFDERIESAWPSDAQRRIYTRSPKCIEAEANLEKLIAHEREQAAAGFKKTLTAIGDRATCKGCAAAIVWVTTKNGKTMPINADDGLAHWATCPQAANFRRPR